MILGIRSDQPQFRSVRFTSGFNVILAERTESSSEKDSRNGVGKTMLLRIIDFCLGSTYRANEGVGNERLRGWTFTLDLQIGNKIYAVSRNTDDQTRVILDGDFSEWPIQPELDALGRYEMDVRTWKNVLGALMFGLDWTDERKYKPTFRSLISYFIRIGREAYTTPFEHFRKQVEWDKQVNSAFLLGLGWEYASRWQVLKDRENDLRQLRRLAKSGSELVPNIIGSIGELEAERIRLDELVRRQRKEIENFQVHPQYDAIRERADSLTRQMHNLTNQNLHDSKTIEFYQHSLYEEESVTVDRIQDIYREAGVIFPWALVKRLEEVADFHRQITTNRKNYLQSEINRLQTEIAERRTQIQVFEEERASHLAILTTHGALEEFTKIQERNLENVSKLRTVIERINSLRRLEQETSALRIEKEQLLLDALADHESRLDTRKLAVSIFDANSQAIYESPGSLIVDIDITGFKFDVDIIRDASDGIKQIGKVFTYDLTIAELWSHRSVSPGFLIHDSAIFDGVDERQKAIALKLAKEKAEVSGFQYICCINSDSVPYRDIQDDFDFDQYVRLTLTDDSPEGALLGIRF